MTLIQIQSGKFDPEIVDGERVLSADISSLQLGGFPNQFQLITSGGMKVMFESVYVDRFEGDIHKVTYDPMSSAFGSARVVIFND